MRRLLNKNAFDVSYNKNFTEVIAQCKVAERSEQEGTWITDEMESAYFRLHELGIANSVEIRQNNELAGGLYGIRLGNVFFGESMFTKVSNASKYGFIKLVQKLVAEGVKLIDCQIKTDHLVSLGAREINRQNFLSLLKDTF
jgi:leucyl/phenylalanyl-tRNA--protein transferase